MTHRTFSSLRTRAALVAASIPALLFALHQGKAGAADSSRTSGYATRVVASGLTRPGDLAVDAKGRITVLEQATQGRAASVSRIDLGTGVLTLVQTGPDTPAALSVGPGGAVKPAARATAVAPNGDTFWTSPDEGLIYQQRASGGPPRVLASGLESPRGIAIDPEGRSLFYTEVPTPGVAGAAGGSNRVSVLDLRTLSRTVIDSGDPEPAGIAVAPDGSIFFTSASRGAIVQASARRLESGSSATKLTAVLTGASEVPPVTTTATGSALFRVDSSSSPAGGGDDRRGSSHSGKASPTPTPSAPSSRVSFKVTADNITGVTAVRLHQGLPGATGPVVADLYPSSRSGGSGEGDDKVLVGTNDDGEDGDEDDEDSSFEKEGSIVASSLLGPFAGNFAGFVAALQSGQLYVEIETTTHPTGEIRGQVGTAAAGAPDGTIISPAADVTIAAGGSVNFEGTAMDPGGLSLTVLWTFGDGTTSTLLSPGAHTYATAGTFHVTFTATNAAGISDPTPATRTITVTPTTGPLPPNGTITAPATNVTITAGGSVSFAGTVSDPGGLATTVLWNFGDGSTSTLPSPGSHTYATAGTFTVTFTATNSAGLADPTPATRTITVNPVAGPQPPNGTIVAPAANTTITAGGSVVFTGAVTDPAGLATTVLWNFGDGSTSTLLSPGAHTYATAGTFTVTFTATNSAGLADPTPATRTITVNPGTTAPTLTQIQTQIFTPSCVGCHSGAIPAAGLNLSAGVSFQSLVNVPAQTLSGIRVVPGNAAQSALVIQLQSGHRNTTQAQQQLIIGWINAGALNN